MSLFCKCRCNVSECRPWLNLADLGRDCMKPACYKVEHTEQSCGYKARAGPGQISGFAKHGQGQTWPDIKKDKTNSNECSDSYRESARRTNVLCHSDHFFTTTTDMTRPTAFDNCLLSVASLKLSCSWLRYTDAFVRVRMLRIPPVVSLSFPSGFLLGSRL